MNFRYRSVVSLALKIVATLSLLLLHTTISNVFGLGAYGSFSLGMLVATIAGEISTLGWSRSITRFLVEAAVNRDNQEFSYILRESHKKILVASIVTMVAIFSVSMFLPDKGKLMPFIFGLLLIPVFALNSVRKKILINEKKVVSALFPIEVLLPLIFSSICILMQYRSIEAYLIFFVVVHYLVCGAMSFYMINSLRYPIDFRSKYKSKYKYTRTSMLVLVGIVGQIVVNRVDLIFIGSFMSTEDMGIYASATRVARLMPFFLGVITLVVSPVLARYFAEKNYRAFKKVLLLCMLGSTLVSLPLFVIYMLFPEKILGLFGPEFTVGSTILIILSCGQLVNAITGPAANALLVTGQEKSYAVSYAIFSVISIPLIYTLWFFYEMLGVAIGMSVMISFLNLSQLCLVLFKLKAEESSA